MDGLYYAIFIHVDNSLWSYPSPLPSPPSPLIPPLSQLVSPTIYFQVFCFSDPVSLIMAAISGARTTYQWLHYWGKRFFFPQRLPTAQVLRDLSPLQHPHRMMMEPILCPASYVGVIMAAVSSGASAMPCVEDSVSCLSTSSSGSYVLPSGLPWHSLSLESGGIETRL